MGSLAVVVSPNQADEEAAVGVGSGAQSCLLQRLHATISALAPLTGPITADLAVKLQLHDLDDAMVLGDATVAALGGALGSCMSSLVIEGACSLAPSLWAALPKHLPCMRSLSGDSGHLTQDPAALAALRQFIATYKSQPLELVISDLPGLRSALGLPPGEGNTVQLPLV